MGRAPCCEKMGLKKGPWTSEEDKILISHIQKHGHSNWRALPKQAGLLRCGKSCRLRWINYLRPDIKRGNFTLEEEETIIKLHATLGNRWSAIAAKLPGRTDNEIKNVWHTHLKKRLKQKNDSNQMPKCDDLNNQSENSILPESIMESPASPQPSSSDISTVTENSSSVAISETSNISTVKGETIDSSEFDFPVIDQEFWSETELIENSNVLEFPVYDDTREFHNISDGPNSIIDDGMDFWYNLFVNSGGIEELL
ncbi:hypothetical protein JCGZ_02330 [Jatropha curcas]|uniref:MYB family protein n=1 Tax=Jatropha curcas TaxID=180498 RepID=A0A067KW19_JATCU|nr:transcription factor MYB30 [Jatropha curcas]AIT52248.1 MYB family protein [Jatropha curcas]KDP40332.1 hypothetical protein JCGZ_02330 [Jatropha curcas]